MSSRSPLRQLDLMLLLALMRLGDNAYGLSVAREIEDASGRDVPLASLYAALTRLEECGLIASELGEPTPERGGRAKRYFRATAKGVDEARAVKRTLTKLWQRLPTLAGHRA